MKVISLTNEFSLTKGKVYEVLEEIINTVSPPICLKSEVVMLKLAEECNEYAAAVAKYLIGEGSREDILEELADGGHRQTSGYRNASGRGS